MRGNHLWRNNKIEGVWGPDTSHTSRFLAMKEKYNSTLLNYYFGFFSLLLAAKSDPMVYPWASLGLSVSSCVSIQSLLPVSISVTPSQHKSDDFQWLSFAHRIRNKLLDHSWSWLGENQFNSSSLPDALL